MRRYLIGTAVFALANFVALAQTAPVCATCHPKETARFAKTAMGNSLIAPAPLPAGRITHGSSVITIEERGGRMIHALAERGLTAEYPIQYQIGGGLMGRSYMIQRGDYLFESPASWYNSSGWDLSPGYSHTPLIDFDRPMEEQCLFCHAGSAQFSDPDSRRLKNTQLTSITCERCHGDSAAHVRHPSAKNIVNPAKLTGAARDSVCEQCHLEGANRTLNPGRKWTDFHAGERTEETFATYILTGGPSASTPAVSQVEQLAESKCARRSGGKLWCATCHDPHGVAANGVTVNRAREIKAICTSCHATLSAAAHPDGYPAGQKECTSCHMPRNPTTDISHAAITDHRILRRPGEAAEVSAGPAQVNAWREPPTVFRERDRAVAEIVIGFARKLPDIGQDGVHLLQAIPAAVQRQDATIVSDLEGLAMQQQEVQKAVELGKRAKELQPASARVAMNFALVLNKSGDSAGAEHELNRAIELDPSLKQAYMELATLYDTEGKQHDAIETLDRYLKWNPQDIVFRLQRAQVAEH